MDTQRAVNMGCYGYPKDTTPNIEAIAREGVTCLNNISPGSRTLPSHASMWTGKYATSHGADIRHEYVEPGLTTLPEVLTDPEARQRAQQSPSPRLGPLERPPAGTGKADILSRRFPSPRLGPRRNRAIGGTALPTRVLGASGELVVRQLAAQALAQRAMARLDGAMTRTLQTEVLAPRGEAMPWRSVALPARSGALRCGRRPQSE